MRKIHARQLTLKNIHARNLITKKNSYGSKIPHHPHTFSNSQSLTLSGFTEHQIIFYQVSNTITYINIWNVKFLTDSTVNKGDSFVRQ